MSCMDSFLAVKEGVRCAVRGVQLPLLQWPIDHYLGSPSLIEYNEPKIP